MKKRLKAYIKGIKRSLPCYDSAMQKMLKNLKQDIETYIEENNVLDFWEIENHFGTAEAVAQEFSAGIDDSRIKSYKRKITLTIIITSIVVVAFMIFTALVTYIVIDTVTNMPMPEETTITYENVEIIEE